MGLKQHITRDQRVLGLPGVPGMAENNSALRGLASFYIKGQLPQSPGADTSIAGEVIVSRAPFTGATELGKVLQRLR